MRRKGNDELTVSIIISIMVVLVGATFTLMITNKMDNEKQINVMLSQCPILPQLELKKAIVLSQIEWDSQNELMYGIKLNEFIDAGGCK